MGPLSPLELRQRYYCPLAPGVLAEHLRQVVQPPGTPIPLFRPPAYLGTVDAAARTFTARMPRSRSAQVSCTGHWQLVQADGGSIIVLDLVVSIPQADVATAIFGGGLMLLAALAILLAGYPLAAGILVGGGMFCGAIPWMSLRTTKGKFERALLLRPFPLP